jgi:glycosyltransferase involved in cell wall biosynthesis
MGRFIRSVALKIVLGASHYPPAHVGGAEVLTEQAARWLVARGHSVEVVCVEAIDAKVALSVQTENREGVLIHRLGLKLAGRGEHLGLRYRDDALGEWLSDFFIRSRPDFSHSQSCYLLTASTLEAARRAGLPTVVTLHDYWFLCPRITLLRSNGRRCVGMATPADCTWCLMGERRRYKLVELAAAKIRKPRLQGSSATGPLRWPLDRRLWKTVADRRAYLDAMLGEVDQILIPAPLALELLLARGFSPERLRLMPYGLDLGAWRGLPRVPADGALRIGYLGQVVPHKGVHLLIEAFRRLSTATRPAELRIHGDETASPQYAERLRRLAAGHPRIRFAGRYDNREVEGILSGLDVVVVPSTWFEVWPVVIMEAFAAGVPVVASRLPNLQDQVRDEVDGLLFTADDVSDLARQLQRLADEPDLVRRLGKNITPVRTVDQAMAETESVYRSLLANNTARASEGLALLEGTPI